MKEEIDIDYLRDCMYLDNNSTLIWKERPQSHFLRHNDCKSWNTRLAGKEVGTITRKGDYRCKVFNLQGRRHYYHRAVWCLYYGSWPKSLLDHKDQNPLNNNIDNLVESDFSANGKNRTLNNNSSTGVTGVTYTRKGNFFSFVAKGWDSERKKWMCLLSTKDFFEAVCARKVWEIANGYSRNHGNSRKCLTT